MTDLEIRRHILNLYHIANGIIESAKENNLPNVVLYNTGYKSACEEMIRTIDFNMARELNEMENQENDSRKNP